jgi:hypothetical protein
MWADRHMVNLVGAFLAALQICQKIRKNKYVNERINNLNGIHETF